MQTQVAAGLEVLTLGAVAFAGIVVQDLAPDAFVHPPAVTPELSLAPVLLLVFPAPLGASVVRSWGKAAAESQSGRKRRDQAEGTAAREPRPKCAGESIEPDVVHGSLPRIWRLARCHTKPRPEPDRYASQARVWRRAIMGPRRGECIQNSCESDTRDRVRRRTG